MDIAYVTDQVLPQTATDTEQLVTMSAAFGDTGCDITVVTPSHWIKEDCSLDEIAHYYHVNPSFNIYPIKGAVPFIRGIEKLVHAFVAAFRVARWENIDVVYTRNLPVVIAFLLFSNKKIIYETYRPWPDQNRFAALLFKWFNKKKNVSGLILHSQLAAESYREIGFDEDRLLVAHNGVDLESYHEDKITKEQARKSLGWNLNERIITYTGRVNKEKGLHLFLKLARDYKDICFVIVGSEGRGKIEQQAERLENVSVYPWQSIEDIPKFLFASDILFIPPTVKPLVEVGNTVLPMKTFIYLASGKAIVAPKTPDIEEVLTNNENALLVPPDDYNSLQKAVERLLRDDNLREELGKKAGADSLEYSWEKRAKKILKFISD